MVDETNQSSGSQASDKSPFRSHGDVAGERGKNISAGYTINLSPGEIDRREMSNREAAEKRAHEHELSPPERLERLEMLCAKYFGVEHFVTVSETVFDPEAERNSARIRFQQEMERIETEARKSAN